MVQMKGWLVSERRGRWGSGVVRVEEEPWESFLQGMVRSIGGGGRGGRGRGRGAEGKKEEGRGARGGKAYERKVDFPQEGSPRRRMLTVGGSSSAKDMVSSGWGKGALWKGGGWGGGWCLSLEI